MPDTNVVFPSFIQGVSTQSETQRGSTTVAEAINSYLDVSRGASKRNGLKHRFSIDVQDPDKIYDYFWLEAGGKQFLMLVSEDNTDPIQIFDLEDGSRKFPSYTNGKGYINAGGDFKGKLRVLSVFDSTIIVNTTVETALGGPSTNWSVTKTKVDYTEAVTDGELAYVNRGNTLQLLNSNLGFPAGYYRVVNPGPDDQTEFDNTFPKLERLRSPDANFRFQSSTMPVQMIYDAVADTFTVDFPDWAERKSGDQDTSPGPSFIGRTIDDIVFHRGRLWLFADETVNASSRSGVFDFWINDILSITAADPIDEFLSDEGLNKIQYAVPFSRSLNIFTKGSRQFEIRSDGPMAPDSISIIPTSNYGVNDKLRPERIGNQLYFFTQYTDYGQMFEYFFRERAATNIATDVTQHVRGYIDEDITNATGEVNNGVLVCHGDDTKTAFIYKSLWAGDEKIQNGWSKWILPDTGYSIVSSQVFGDNIWFLLKTEGTNFGSGPTPQYIMGTISVQAEETDSDLPYPVHLDFFVNKSAGTGTYDSSSNTTYWDLPYYHDGEITAIPTSGDKAGLPRGTTTQQQTEHSVRVSVIGDWTGEDFTFGIPFQYKIEFNPPYIKDRSGNPVTGSFATKKVILYVRDAVRFSLNQTVPGLSSMTSTQFTSAQMSADKVQYGEVPVVTFGNPSFIVLGRSENMKLYVEDESPYPLTLVSAEFRGFFSNRRQVQ